MISDLKPQGNNLIGLRGSIRKPRYDSVFLGRNVTSIGVCIPQQTRVSIFDMFPSMDFDSSGIILKVFIFIFVFVKRDVGRGENMAAVPRTPFMAKSKR